MARLALTVGLGIAVAAIPGIGIPLGFAIGGTTTGLSTLTVDDLMEIQRGKNGIAAVVRTPERV